MTLPSEFTGIPFVAGSIFGERCWKVSTEGALVSPTYPYGWTQENVSQCRRMLTPPDVPYDEVVSFLETFLFKGERAVVEIQRKYAYGGLTIPSELIVHWEDIAPKKAVVTPNQISRSGDDLIELQTIDFKEQGVVTLNWIDLYNVLRPKTHEDWISPVHDFSKCSCGFYAYTHGDNDYLRDNWVLGVVEGYGETLIGTRGFRSSKARIVAITGCPTQSDEEETDNAIGRAIVSIVNMTSAASGAASSFGTISTSKIYAGSETKVVEAGTQNPFRPPSSALLNSEWSMEIHPVVDQPVDWDKVLAKYPGAVYFESVEKMRAEFPSTDTSEWIDKD